MPEAPLTPAAVHAAQPRLLVDGREEEMPRDLLLAAALREEEGGLASLELRFAATAVEAGSGLGLSLAEGAVIDLGQELRLAMGPEHDRTEMFAGRVSALELLVEEGDQPQLVVRAEDALMRERRRRFSRLHPAGRLRDIAGMMRVPRSPICRSMVSRSKPPSRVWMAMCLGSGMAISRSIVSTTSPPPPPPISGSATPGGAPGPATAKSPPAPGDGSASRWPAGAEVTNGTSSPGPPAARG